MIRTILKTMLIAAAVWPAQGAAQMDRCADTLDPMLAQLAVWTQTSDSGQSYRYCAFVSGASLALGYDPATGFRVPARQAALWPGNVFGAADSAFQPIRAFSWEEAESLLVAGASRTRGLMVFTDRPVVVTGVDTSLGAPWFFVSMCDSSRWDSAIWDRGDFKQQWWQRINTAGARVMWVVPDSAQVTIGRSVTRSGMRNSVLAARPDSADGAYYGLAASAAAAADPNAMAGRPEELQRLTSFRQLAADFLGQHAELWPPDERDPVKLAAYYFQKSAEAWRTLSAVAETWTAYDPGQRRDWLRAVNDWDTKAAVALDGIVSGG